MRLKMPKKLNQVGSLHLIIPLILAVVIIGAVLVKVSSASDATGGGAAAAKQAAKKAAKTPVKNVAYANASPLQALDIFPSSTSNAPLVVLVHGGGWTTNDKSQFGIQAKALQNKGMTVFNVNYRLDSATVAAFPMEIDDVKAATKYAIAHANQYGASSAKVTLLGGSAGGQLVGMAAEQLNATSAGTVNKVVSLSGPTDFVSLVQDAKNGTLKNNQNKEDKNFVQNIPQALGCTLNACTTATEVQWSPAQQLTAANCPAGGWMVINSQSELIPMDQPNAMISALQSKGCKVTPNILTGNMHAFAYWGTVKPAIVSFIQQ